MESDKDKLDRLVAMSVDNGSTWDLSDNDQEAIKWAISEINRARQNAVESPGTDVQQLKAEIAALADCMLAGPTGDDCYIREYANELRQLSAV